MPDEIMGDDGEPMSPRMHLTIHTIVERQLSADEPEGVVEIAEQLESNGGTSKNSSVNSRANSSKLSSSSSVKPSATRTRS